MKTIVDVAIAPKDAAKLTPLELLRDFADATPGWHYLERDSEHYAEAKEVPAGVIRHMDLDGSKDVDLAFTAGPGSANSSALRLRLIDPQGNDRSLGRDDRDAILDHFLKHFERYLDTRSAHARLHVEEDEEGKKVGG